MYLILVKVADQCISTSNQALSSHSVNSHRSIHLSILKMFLLMLDNYTLIFVNSMQANERACEERQATYNCVLNEEHSVDGQLVAADVLRKNLHTLFHLWQRKLGEESKAM